MMKKLNWLIIMTLAVFGFTACGDTADQSSENAQVEPDTDCTGGKCDDFSRTKVDLLTGLEMQILESDTDAGTQTVHFVGLIDEEFRELVPWCTYQSCGARNDDVHKLDLTIWASDQFSDPEYKIEGEIELDEAAEPGAGVITPDARYTTPEGFATEDFDSFGVVGMEIDLIPWGEITVRVTGELDSDTYVDQTFVFNVIDCAVDGDMEVCPPQDDQSTSCTTSSDCEDGFMCVALQCVPTDMGSTSVELLSDLEMQILDSDPDAGTQTVHFVGPIRDALRELVPWCTYQSCGAQNGDVHKLDLTIWASDGASNPEYKIEGEIELDEAAESGAGVITPDAKYTTPWGFATDDFDSYGIVGMEIDLLPWQQITVQVTGGLYTDSSVDQTFIFNVTDCEPDGEITICSSQSTME